MKFTHVLASTAFAFTALTANAHAAPASSADHAAHHPAAATAPQSEGEVLKVDREQGKVTLRHGPLANLDMPAMTMVFKAANPKLLAGLTEGEKVKFTAEKTNGAITVTAIQVAN
jgi:Cu/Ag efflux protein CusF